jgi:hypothetical protein
VSVSVPTTLPLGSTQKHFRRGHLADYWGVHFLRAVIRVTLDYSVVNASVRVGNHRIMAGRTVAWEFPDHEILPDEHGRPCGDLDGWGELMPAGASGQAGFGIRAGGLASGGS